MTDLIDRQGAYDVLSGYYHHNTEMQHESLREALGRVPSAQPEPRWIPVGERLPDSSGNYLVSIKSIGWNCEKHVVNDIAYWDSSEGFHKAYEVIAWMPLPKPYERSEDE